MSRNVMNTNRTPVVLDNSTTNNYLVKVDVDTKPEKSTTEKIVTGVGISLVLGGVSALTGLPFYR